jgi:phenylalanyl-tRNA synthetase beta chain
MPTISCYYKDLEKLYGQKIKQEELPDILSKAKAEFKDHDEKTGELKIELVDTNRPDLWCVEGIARQLREAVLHKKSDYSFFSSTPSEKEKISVDVNLKNIRPYIGGFLAINIEVNDSLLTQLIQTQEKLCVNYGRNRELIAIGVYDASKIEFPLYYKGFKEKEITFAPLGFSEQMDLGEILEKHPKGQEYSKLVKKYPLCPVIMDKNKNILSFPPVINSEDLGKVVEGNEMLFVEVTGTSMESVILCTNILACNMSDRGAEIKPFYVEYEGKRVITPQNLKQIVSVEKAYLEKMLGESITTDSIIEQLSSMGFSVRASEDNIICESPPYRRDCIHPVDLVEDYAIARDYNSFRPQMPEKYTVGAVSPLVEFGDTVRMLMTGMGFEEFITYILTGKDRVFDKMRRSESGIVEVENVMTDTYSILRPSLLPVLLEIESKNLRVEFPHKIFEEGEVVIYSPEENYGSKTVHNLSALVSHSSGNFSEIHSYLHSLMFYLDIPYKLEETADPSFIDGRVGKIIYSEREIGIIGEIHPEVLERFGINMPVSAFEITLNLLRK